MTQTKIPEKKFILAIKFLLKPWFVSHKSLPKCDITPYSKLAQLLPHLITSPGNTTKLSFPSLSIAATPKK